MFQQVRQSVIMLCIMVMLTGLAYPLALTGVFELALPVQARSSLVMRGDSVVGSRLVGQSFVRPEYFHPRPSNAGDGYNAALSGASNLGPTNAGLIETVRGRADAYKALNATSTVPVDAVTSSGSGLDPHISTANAVQQAGRVAAVRGFTRERVLELISEQTQRPLFSIYGSEHVNVLMLNLALDAEAQAPASGETTP